MEFTPHEIKLKHEISAFNRPKEFPSEALQKIKCPDLNTCVFSPEIQHHNGASHSFAPVCVLLCDPQCSIPSSLPDGLIRPGFVPNTVIMTQI